MLAAMRRASSRVRRCTAERGAIGGRPPASAMPTVYENREFVAAGGLMSYGGNLIDAYRQCATYAARILKGEKPPTYRSSNPRKLNCS